MYGKVPANAMTIDVYSIDNVLVRSFTSQVTAANWVNIPRTTFLGGGPISLHYLKIVPYLYHRNRLSIPIGKVGDIP